MKKLFLVATTLLLSLVAGAREVEPLLAPDGALFSIRTQLASETPDVKSDAVQYLVLDARRDGEMTSAIIPATLTKGAHGSAAMAYDTDSKTLFVFWLHETGVMSSELVFASLDGTGAWSEPTTFGMPYNSRENLRIAVTRKIHDTDQNKLTSGLSVHAVWWEYDSQHLNAGWSAQYALLAIENGRVEEVNFLDLSRFVDEEKPAKTAAASESASVLRHPQLFTSPNHDSALVVFGHVATDRLYRARIFPVKGNGRLRVPTGRREGGAGAPRLQVNSNSGMGSIYGDVDQIALYAADENQVRYVILRGNEWSEVRTISLDAQITAPAAIDAIRRLVTH